MVFILLTNLLIRDLILTLCGHPILHQVFEFTFLYNNKTKKRKFENLKNLKRQENLKEKKIEKTEISSDKFE